MGRESIGELEHLILLAVMSLASEASARGVRDILDQEGRGVTRGALYRSLDRLAEKDLIEWEVEEAGEERGGHPRRIYRVSESGRQVLAERRETLERLWARAAGARS